MKRFLVILGLTVVVWLGVSMSAESVYPVQMRVTMVGYDTVRYAVVSADTVLPLQVRMSGFNAFWGTLRHQKDTLQVTCPQDRGAVAVSSLTGRLRNKIHGAQQVTSTVDSLRIVLSERSSRAYRPVLDDVDFTFANQYGLYGEPTITPAEVTLYGPMEALSQIGEVRVAAANLDGISTDGTYRLPLEPVWQQYADVRPSCTDVDVYLPVEAYVEREYKVPIRVLDADSTVSLRIYPEEATVRVWVPQRDLHREPEFVVAVDYADVLLYDGHLSPRLLQFPAYVRPRKVEPQDIQVVIIR